MPRALQMTPEQKKFLLTLKIMENLMPLLPNTLVQSVNCIKSVQKVEALVYSKLGA